MLILILIYANFISSLFLTLISVLNAVFTFFSTQNMSLNITAGISANCNKKKNKNSYDSQKKESYIKKANKSTTSNMVGDWVLTPNNNEIVAEWFKEKQL